MGVFELFEGADLDIEEFFEDDVAVFGDGGGVGDEDFGSALSFDDGEVVNLRDLGDDFLGIFLGDGNDGRGDFLSVDGECFFSDDVGVLVVFLGDGDDGSGGFVSVDGEGFFADGVLESEVIFDDTEVFGDFLWVGELVCGGWLVGDIGEFWVAIGGSFTEGDLFEDTAFAFEESDMDGGCSLSFEAEELSGASGEVDDSVFDEGSSVVDSDDDGSLVLEVQDFDEAWHGECFVCGGDGVLVESFAVGGIFSVEVGAVPGGDAGFLVVPVFLWEVSDSVDDIWGTDFIFATC